MGVTQRETVERLLAEHGTTYAEDAGITLRDKPSPLYQLLVLTTLASARISADLAVAAARELFAAGWRTPDKMRASTWQQRVDALGRGRYTRYDESTAAALDDSATMVQERYAGDLRGLKERDDLLAAVAEFPRIGPVGAGIFVREVQDVWGLDPFFDDKTLEAAAEQELPTDPKRLAALAPAGRVAHLAAALTRTSRAGGPR